MRSVQLLVLVLLATAARADTFTWYGLEAQNTSVLPGPFSERVPTPEEMAGVHEAILANSGPFQFGDLGPFVEASPEFASRNGFVVSLLSGNMADGDFIYRNALASKLAV